jgi:hypothetical protein
MSFANYGAAKSISLGPKLFLNTSYPTQGLSGKDSFTLQSTTNNDIKFLLSLSENGMSKIDCGGSIQVTCGHHHTFSGDQTAFEFLADNGDFSIDVKNGHMGLHAKTITLDALEKIVIKCPKEIIIGDTDDPMGCTKIALNCQNIDLEPIIGVLASLLKTDMVSKSTAGSFIDYNIGGVSG